MTRTPTCWFPTDNRGRYCSETLAKQSCDGVNRLGAAGTMPVPGWWQPVLTESESIQRNAMAASAGPDCVAQPAWMSAFFPPKACEHSAPRS